MRDILSVIKITYKWDKDLKYYQNTVAREEDEGSAATIYIQYQFVQRDRLQYRGAKQEKGGNASWNPTRSEIFAQIAISRD